MDKKFYRIEEVADKTGLTKRALRYYEDIELLKPIRTESSYRLYSEEDVENILKIKELRDNLGFNLNEVKSIISLEKELKSIFLENSKDIELIEKSKHLINEQIELIKIKEKTLSKVKIKYKEALLKLERLQNENNGGNNL